MPDKKIEDMTPEELKEYAKTLEKNQSNQNKYITELESKKGKDVNPEMKLWFQKQRMKDYENEGIKLILDKYSEKVYEAVKDDFKNWINKNAKPEQVTNEKFFVSAFQMVLGNAIGDKDHAVHKALGAPQKVETPEEKALRLKQNEDGHTPAPLSEKDSPSLTEGGDQEPTHKYRNTDEAMGTLQTLVANANINPYEN